MKIKLNVLERLTVSSLLPEQGSYLNLGIIREAKEALTFTEAEHKKFGLLALPNGSIQWTKDGQKSVELGDIISKMIADALLKLDKEEKLEERHVSVYDKFIK